MSAANTDYFTKISQPGGATFLAAPGHTSGGTSINVDSTSLWPTDTGVIFAIDTVSIGTDGSETRDTGSYTVWEGVVSSATSITGMVLKYGTDQNYPAGSTTRVYILPTASRENRTIDGLLVEHLQTGIHALTSSATITSSKLITSLNDTNGNEIFKVSPTASAVNEITLTNAATGNAPNISASGGDSNIDLKLTPKGTGKVVINGFSDGWQTNALPAYSSATYNGNRSTDVTFASTVASYLTPGMRLRFSRTVAAPTQSTSLNGTTQYYSKTSPAGMTFTDDFTVSAWIKLSSYQNSIVVSRHNGTSGWYLNITASGTVGLVGTNASASNFSQVFSYQSIPLNKWVHIAAQLDMSAFTATTTTSYVMIDGVDVPAVVSRGGTNPTALVQAGNLEIGSFNGGTVLLAGKVAQVAIYNAKVTQANVRATISQTLAGTETSLISAYSFNNTINDLNANANNLTANGSAVATNADSPFSQDSNGVPSGGGNYDWGIVTKVATTVVTVQTPEGSAIPTSGGVSSVDMSAWKVPFGFPVQRDKWEITSIIKLILIQSSPSAGTWYNVSSTTSVAMGALITPGIGEWSISISCAASIINATNAPAMYTTLSTAAATESDQNMTSRLVTTTASANSFEGMFYREKEVSLAAATSYYFNIQSITASATQVQTSGTVAPLIARARLSLL